MGKLAPPPGPLSGKWLTRDRGPDVPARAGSPTVEVAAQGPDPEVIAAVTAAQGEARSAVVEPQTVAVVG